MGKFSCTTPGCHFPMVGKDTKQHNNWYHNSRSYRVPFLDNETKHCERKDGLLQCPCGDTEHSKYNRNVFEHVLGTSPHDSLDLTEERFREPFPEWEWDPDLLEYVVNDSHSQQLRARAHNEDYPMEDAEELSIQHEAQEVDTEMEGVEETGGLEDDLYDDNMGGSEGLRDDSDRHEVEDAGQRGEGEEADGIEGGDEGDEEADGSEGGDSEDDIDDYWVSEWKDLEAEGPVTDEVLDNLLTRYSLNSSSAPSPQCAIETLRKVDVVVDPTWRWSICISCGHPVHWVRIYQNHIRRHLVISRLGNTPDNTPSESEIFKCLIVLNAHQYTPFPTLTAIEPVPGMEQRAAFQCGYPGCNGIRSTRFRGDQQFIPIIPPQTPPPANHILRDIIKKAEELKLGIPSETYSAPSNSVNLNPIFAQLHWHLILEAVNISLLRKSAATPDPETEQAYCRIKETSQLYYQKVMLSLDALDTTTRRWIRTSSQNTPLKSVPFRRPQELGTVTRDADFVSTFLVFLLRHTSKALDNFPIYLTDVTKSHIQRLHEQASTSNVDDASDDALITLFHRAIWTYVTSVDQAYHDDELNDPLTRFVVAYHIQDDYGAFASAKQLPLNLIKAQWCFRASGAWEIICKRHEFGNVAFDTYETLVQPWLTDGRPSTFTKLRENIKRLSELAYNQPTRARFSWDPSNEVISIDGFPLSAKGLFTTWKDCLGSLTESIDVVFQGCNYTDILNSFDAHMDPDPGQCAKWFHDSTSCNDHRYSIFDEKLNDIDKYRPILRDHLACDERFFKSVAVVTHPNYRESFITCAPLAILTKVFEETIKEWFGLVQDVVNMMWYLIHATAPGSARGRENEPLTYANHPNHPKNLHFISGHLCLETVYCKTASQQGTAGEAITRAMPWQVGRLVLLVIGCIYYAAAHLGAMIGMPKECLDNYMFYMFVRNGQPMTSKDFSKVLGNVTESTLGYPLLLWDWRQLKFNLMLHKANVSWDEPDDEEEEDRATHKMLAHSAIVGQTSYGVQSENATKHLSQDLVASQLRTAVRWQRTIEFLHPSFRKLTHQGLDVSFAVPMSPEAAKAALEELLAKQSTLHEQAIIHSEERIKAWMIDALNSLGVQILKDIKGTKPHPHSPSPPIFVSKDILPIVMRNLFPNIPSERWAWRSPQQAESVASVLSSNHVFSILSTGEGKSLQFFAAPLLKPDRLFVVILPLISLTEDMLRRAQAITAYKAGVWGSQDFDTHTTSLVFVSAHEAGTATFGWWINSLEISKRLDRIFIDEAHHLKTDSNFRECFASLIKLRTTKVPFSFLSGSLGPHDIDFVLSVMGIEEKTLVTEIRSYCGCPNHRYTLEKLSSSDSSVVISAIKHFMDRHPLKSDERGLIYVSSVELCKDIGAALGIPAYYSAETAQNKAAFQCDWRGGYDPGKLWMVCTPAFGEGIDYGAVRCVIVYEPFGMTPLKQYFGRAGQDDLLAFCHLLYSCLPFLPDNPEQDLEGRIPYYQLLVSPSCMCFSEYAYDREVHCCAAIGAELCQNCLDGPPSISLQQPLQAEIPSNPSNPVVDVSVPPSPCLLPLSLSLRAILSYV
ncbi:hypothetical protein D9758_015611 [Tetrapyrgos nigripes]|uniref:DNA 3'-5' helicase n=1 Tax=Tetrapyrgos nigripes TaxID=182062 RepID=A0A8H5CKD8_9AGAR|nr:hypothetical protein D9758_015611 [Tetrapyrgos nigripes]